MTQSNEPEDTSFRLDLSGRVVGKRVALVLALLGLVVLPGCLLLWHTFFVYVPPGKHLVVTANDGRPRDDPDQVLVGPGEQGIQRDVLGEGWHFLLPIVYRWELKDNTVIPPGKVGVVTALGGKPPADGRVLAEEGEKGIQRQVLPPGMYRINLYGSRVEVVDATDIKPGYHGVLRRKLGTDGKGRFADNPDEKGILRAVLAPGLYYLNPYEFEVAREEVGIFQTTFRYDADPAKSTAITFTSKGGFPISLDCTVEWEVLPADLPALVAEYGSRRAVERTVIDVQAHAIGRDKGIDYGVQDFLEGAKREKFQEDFTEELTRACQTKGVTVHSAFIRNITIPEEYLKPIRDKQIAAETERTNQAKETTAESEAAVEREQRTIQQKVAEVKAETERLVASVDREVENLKIRTDAEIEKLKAENEAQVAALDAERTKVAGEAAAEVTRLTETARSSLYELKMEVFQRDAAAFLKYTLSEQMNPELVLRLFQSGPGTFWTNMDGKSVNLMVPTGAPAVKKPAAEK